MEQNCLFRIEETDATTGTDPATGLAMVSVDHVSLQQSTKANEKKTRGGVSPRRMIEKIKQQGFRCFFTGIELQREDASVDHVVPLARGGKHEEANLELVHSAINRMKGTMTGDEFVAWCVKVAVHSGGCTLPR